MQTAQLLTYAGPPLIGALIGYLTNKVAIKMLFRPLKPWYIFGKRLPLTPGIIPAKRHELAENIGKMVGDQLLTPQDVGQALSTEAFQEHLHRLVDRRVQEILSKDLGTVLDLVPAPFRIHVKIGLRMLKYHLRQGFNQQLASPAFIEAVTELFRRQEETLNTVLAGEKVQQHLASWLEQALRTAAAEGKSLADFLPQSLQELLWNTAAEQSPQLLAQAAALLGEPAIQDQIVQTILKGIDHFLDSLGPMAAVAKGLINTGNIEGIIRKWLMERDGDLAVWLQRPDIEERVGEVLRERAKAFLTTPVAHFLVRLEAEQVQELCTQVAAHCIKALPLLIRSFGASENIHSLLTSETMQQFGGKMINALVDGMIKRPLGSLHKLLPGELRQGISSYLVLSANRFLLHEVPGLTESLRIQNVVQVKVDSLDLLRLENLLLSIMEEQFRYINLFGALLGFLIGLVNLLLLGLM